MTAPLFRLGLRTGKAAIGAGSVSTKNGGSKFWQPIGAMWPHADPQGFNLRIDYLPLNDAEIVVRVAGDKQAAPIAAFCEGSAPEEAGASLATETERTSASALSHAAEGRCDMA